MACFGAMGRFEGYPLLTSNTTFTPNGFFDVAVPTLRLPALRVVAFMLRRTLGWSDASGKPLHPVHSLSWKELAEGAGVSRSAIGAALSAAMKGHFIECHSEAHANASGTRYKVAEFALKWSHSREYTADPKRFDGFYQFSGCRTIVPNAFFDHTVKSEPLSVVKVVAAIIRDSVGWEDKWGFRRQEATLSFSALQRKTGLSRETVSIGLKQALERGHLRRVEAGQFSSDAQKQRTAVYALNWSEPNSGQERSADPTRRIVSQSDQGLVARRSPDPTRNGSEIRPETRSPDPTIKKIKDQNNNYKQQCRVAPLRDGVDQQLVKELLAHEVSRGVAVRLARAKPEECRRQLEFMRYLSPRQNPGGWLREAIENELPAPPAYVESKKQEALREQQAKRTKEQAARQRREELHRGTFLHYLSQRYDQIKSEHPEAFLAFVEHEREERAGIVRDWFSPRMLSWVWEEFDRTDEMLTRLVRFFSSRPSYGIFIPNFETWVEKAETRMRQVEEGSRGDQNSGH